MSTPRYRAIFKVTGSTSVVVDAENPDEAERLACLAVSIDLCHACARQLEIDDIELALVEEEN